MKAENEAFLMGVGFYYLATRRGGVVKATRDALISQKRYYEREKNRVVDPFNRTVL